MTTSGMVSYAYNPNNCEAEAGKSGVQSHPQLPRESEVSLIYKILFQEPQGAHTPNLNGRLKGCREARGAGASTEGSPAPKSWRGAGASERNLVKEPGRVS